MPRYSVNISLFCFSREINDEDTNTNTNTNEVSEHDQNLLDALQRVHLDDGVLSAICVKNFPQQVHLFVSFVT